jgi:hypothetical protein
MKKDLPKMELPQDWEKAKNFIPKKCQIIIYDGVKDGEQYIKPPKMKIGDGVTKVNDLPFEDTTIDISYLANEKILIIN